MKNSFFSLTLIVLFLNGIIASCSTSINTDTELEMPTSTIIPTNTATLESIPTEAASTATVTPEYAPFCDPDPPSTQTPSNCQLPLAEEGTTFCAKKNPYNLLIMNPGVNYETITDGFECSDAGTKDGKQLVTCTGPMVSTFAVQVCDPTCAIPTVQADFADCPSGYVYNDQQGCCSQFFQPVNQNCELLILKTKSCVVDCSQFAKREACDKNSIACEWNSTSRQCQLRR